MTCEPVEPPGACKVSKVLQKAKRSEKIFSNNFGKILFISDIFKKIFREKIFPPAALISHQERAK